MERMDLLEEEATQMRLRLCVCVSLCVCLCVCEKERERERGNSEGLTGARISMAVTMAETAAIDRRRRRRSIGRDGGD